MLKAIIFDMDGVLLDSPRYNFKSFNMALKKYGVQITKDEFAKKYLGGSLRDQLQQWKSIFLSIPKDLDLMTFSAEALDYQMAMFKDELKPNKSILNLIDEAKKNQIKIAVATSSTTDRAKLILGHLGILDKLDTLITSEDVLKHKPSPDIFLKTAEVLNVKPEDCVVIEDAVDGIQAANNAKMKSVAKLTRYHTKEELAEADFIFEDFDGLKLDRLQVIWPGFSKNHKIKSLKNL